MKEVTFGNIIEQEKVFKENVISGEKNIFNDKRFQSNGMEFFNQDDKISARDYNRPIRQLFEDDEANYEIIQTLSKIILGDKKTGIIPDILEEFNPDNVKIGYYFENTSQPFLRIPTGALIINTRTREVNENYNADGYEGYDESNTGNISEIYKKYEDGETNDYNLNNYITRDHNAAIVVNKPKVEFYERELAEHFNFDLNEQGNNINVKYTINSKKELEYTCNVTRTRYNYSANEIVEDNFDIQKLNSKGEYTNIFNNVFDLTNATFNKISSFVNKDGYYSLEETIPLFDTDGDLINDTKDTKEYIVFYRVGDYNDDEYKHYSLSGNYGIIEASNEIYLNDSDKNDLNIELFRISISAQDSNTKTIQVSVLESYLDKIDRSSLDIKNLNISNNYITVDNDQWYLCNNSDLSNMISYNMKN